MPYLELTAEGPKAAATLRDILVEAEQAARLAGLTITVARVTGEDPPEKLPEPEPEED